MRESNTNLEEPRTTSHDSSKVRKCSDSCYHERVEMISVRLQCLDSRFRSHRSERVERSDSFEFRLERSIQRTHLSFRVDVVYVRICMCVSVLETRVKPRRKKKDIHLAIQTLTRKRRLQTNQKRISHNFRFELVVLGISSTMCKFNRKCSLILTQFCFLDLFHSRHERSCEIQFHLSCR